MKKPRKSECHRRLLDMLAGWAQFSSHDRYARAEAGAVADLYQRAARIEPGTPRQIRAFIEDAVVPFVRNGQARDGVHAAWDVVDGRPSAAPHEARSIEAIPYVRQALGHSLRAAREHAGLTRADLAKKLRTTRDAVVESECGTRHVGERYVRKVLKAAGLPRDWAKPRKHGEGPANAMRAIHPGEVLSEEFLVPLEMTVTDLARVIGVSRNRISAIVRERRPVTAEMGLRLSRALGTGAQFWMNLQQAYDLRSSEKRFHSELRAIESTRTRSSQ